MKKKSAVRWLYLASFVVHALAALGLAVIPKKQLDEIVSVVLADVTPAAESQPRPPEPPPAPEPIRPQAAPAPRRAPLVRARPRPAPEVSAAPATTANAPGTAAGEGGTGFDDFGAALGSDGSEGAAGIAVPVGPIGAGGLGDGRPRVVSVSRSLTPVRRAPVARRGAPGGCDEEPSRPRPIHVPRPDYPSDARSAGVSGKVRVRLTVDLEGRVVSAEVLSGPGSGLREAASSAARGARFEPAMRCGRAVQGTFTLGVRFAI